MSTLIAVAHGSRDPRSARTVGAVVEQIRVRRPDLDVRVAFLDLSEPKVDTVLDQVAADGVRSAIMVPLLLGKAFHARVDLPGLIDAARIRHPHLELTQSQVLGDDRRLIDVVRTRIIETGVDVDDPSVGIALAAVGSSDPSANQRMRALAERVLVGTRWAAAVTCFATAQNPGPADCLARIADLGARTIVLAPWFLAPGLLTDRILAAVGDDTVTVAEVIGDHPLVADVVSSRYDAALSNLSTRRSA
nr:sirohydrochlorin chelatase [Rhodococcus sp. (in: high G+C Gram-positive bacteria)]